MKAIQNSFSALFSGTLLVLFLVSCSHPIEIVGNGDVTSASGERDCLLEDFLAGEDNCSKNYAVHDYTEKYFAVPREGWQFDRWVNYCTNVTENQCSFNIPAETVHKYWGGTAAPLQAVFTKIDDPDTVVVDGKEWLQPDLFTGYTWEQINAVCPDGICSGVLPESIINLTGYRWASVEDMNGLFNHFGAELGPGPDYGSTSSEAALAFLESSGFRWMTYNGTHGGTLGLMRYEGPSIPVAFMGLICVGGCGYPSGFAYTNPKFSETTNLIFSDDIPSPEIGAWFYRSL